MHGRNQLGRYGRRRRPCEYEHDAKYLCRRVSGRLLVPLRHPHTSLPLVLGERFRRASLLALSGVILRASASSAQVSDRIMSGVQSPGLSEGVSPDSPEDYPPDCPPDGLTRRKRAYAR
jgi:hypothetical protein